MSAITSITEIYGTDTQAIDLADKSWVDIELGTGASAIYLTGAKEVAQSTDTIDVNKVRGIQLEIGIDSGVANKYITIHRAKLDFNIDATSEEEDKGQLACVLVRDLPRKFKIRVLNVVDEVGKTIKEGGQISSVDINITPVVYR